MQQQTKLESLSKRRNICQKRLSERLYINNIMWRVYKHTWTDKDYGAYKEALDAATNEVRKSKRNFEHILAQNIKSDSKSFYAYVRSKQNVRDKVGPLEDNAGNIKTQGFLMAEELNMHFSSVFTREDTSSIPVPETKFKGSEGERLGQLVVTPEVVVSKINNMKENKSPGVDGISPKILKETIEQISTPLAHVFNMSLKEGIVPLEWKEANSIPLFKKGSRNKSVNYRPVSLTSVICKLLETIISDHMMDFLIIIIIIRQPLCPVVGRRPQHAVSKLPCLVLSSAISCRSSICPGRLSIAWLVSLVVFSCHMVSNW